jgi:hypothetical protein
MQGFAAGKTMRQLTNRFPLAPFFRPKIPPSLRDFLDRDTRHGQADGIAQRAV